MARVKNILNRNGFKLYIKLHPNSINKEIDIELAKLNIISVSNDEFRTTLKKSKFVIGEPSSINAVACLIGIPILTPILKPFNKKRYGLLMEEYPNRIDFESFEDLGNIIKSKRLKSNKLEINNWIEKFAGPLPNFLPLYFYRQKLFFQQLDFLVSFLLQNFSLFLISLVIFQLENHLKFY